MAADPAAFAARLVRRLETLADAFYNPVWEAHRFMRLQARRREAALVRVVGIPGAGACEITPAEQTLLRMLNTAAAELAPHPPRPDG